MRENSRSAAERLSEAILAGHIVAIAAVGWRLAVSVIFGAPNLVDVKLARAVAELLCTMTTVILLQICQGLHRERLLIVGICGSEIGSEKCRFVQVRSSIRKHESRPTYSTAVCVLA